MKKSAARFRDQLSKRLGEKVFLDAQKDLIEGNLHRRGAVPVTASILSVAVLASPFLSIVVGLALIYSTFPNLVAIVIGALFIALGIFLMPRRLRLDENLLERHELPITFGQLDQITRKMGTENITHVQVTPDFNAFMSHAEGARVLGIGAVLWRALEPSEQLAVLAHEIAHQVNGDPARTGLTSKALRTLEGWIWFLEPDADDLFTEIIMYVPFLLAVGLHNFLLRLLFIESQRAEYLADALAARVSGPSALGSVLRKLTLAERIETERLGMHANRIPGGLALIDRFASSVSAIPNQEREAVLANAQTKGLSVDATHPPTHFRIAFLDLINDDTESALSSNDLLAVNAELEAEFENQGNVLQRELKKDEDW